MHPSRERIRRAAHMLPLVALIVGACSDAPSPTAVTTTDLGPRAAIADAPRGYKEGFYWLAPLVRAPSTTGLFDASLSPRVDICELADNDCAATIASYSTSSGPGSELVRLDIANSHYIVNWHTSDFNLDPARFYRISVYAGSNILLGYADVQPVNTGKEVKNVGTDDYIALVNGRTLPIKFRIEGGIVSTVKVTPETATIPVGATQAFVVSITDLHGNPVTAPVIWSSSDNTVASVDANGVVTATGGGTAVISATSQMARGTATVNVPSGPLFTSIAASFHNTCAVATTKQLYCWGGWVVTPFSGSLTPYAMPGQVNYTSVDMATFHTCGTTTSGQAYCQGVNGWGELGDGTFTQTHLFVPVQGGQTFDAIATGREHSCALDMSGAAFCWGHGLNGQLGNGLSGVGNIVLAPSPVLGGHAFNRIVSGLGAAHTCALTPAGSAYCWGNNVRGQLGTGLVQGSATPLPVAGGHTFKQLESGSGTVCGVTTASQLFCWGDNQYGAVGDGTNTHRRSPVAIANGMQFSMVAPNLAHTCAITTGGDAYCWGENFYGQLGDGTNTNSLVPVQVAGGHKFVTIAGGAEHTCALTQAGQAYCWGKGDVGQLGDGFELRRNVPVAVIQTP